MGRATCTSKFRRVSIKNCSLPTRKAPTSTDTFETASDTSASGDPNEISAPILLHNSSKKTKWHWALACGGCCPIADDSSFPEQYRGYNRMPLPHVSHSDGPNHLLLPAFALGLRCVGPA